MHAVRLIVAEAAPAAREGAERAQQSDGLVTVQLADASDLAPTPDRQPPLVRALLRREPASLIVLDGEQSDPDTRARGYVLRTSTAARLAMAMRIVAGGRDYVDPEIEHRVSEDSDHTRLASLSRRESEILGLLAEGLSGQGIARQLYLSPETVRTHVRNATNKLGARTRVQAVALLVRNPEAVRGL